MSFISVICTKEIHYADLYCKLVFIKFLFIIIIINMLVCCTNKFTALYSSSYLPVVDNESKVSLIDRKLLFHIAEKGGF